MIGRKGKISVLTWLFTETPRDINQAIFFVCNTIFKDQNYGILWHI